MNPKFYIGPMSKNVVDAIINFSTKTNNPIGFIPSRRQIDYNGGYVNGWNTHSFSDYIRSRYYTKHICRDHAGANQGAFIDDGHKSMMEDCKWFNCIHLDPWLFCKNLSAGWEMTEDYIKFCFEINPYITFEIGTEQSIMEYTTSELDAGISRLKKSLTEEEFANITTAVIQSGTSLRGNENTGTYDERKLLDMVEVCKYHNLFSKEHNGDYLSTSLIHKKFSCGLDSINIAPEFGQYETQTYLSEIKKEPHALKLMDLYFDICYSSNKWRKWVDSSFDPLNIWNREKLINICGHYVISNKEFVENIKSKLRPDIDSVVQCRIESALDRLFV